jgi:hypothetical protein
MSSSGHDRQSVERRGPRRVVPRAPQADPAAGRGVRRVARVPARQVGGCWTSDAATARSSALSRMPQRQAVGADFSEEMLRRVRGSSPRPERDDRRAAWTPRSPVNGARSTLSSRHSRSTTSSTSASALYAGVRRLAPAGGTTSSTSPRPPRSRAFLTTLGRPSGRRPVEPLAPVSSSCAGCGHRVRAGRLSLEVASSRSAAVRPAETAHSPEPARISVPGSGADTVERGMEVPAQGLRGHR